MGRETHYDRESKKLYNRDNYEICRNCGIKIYQHTTCEHWSDWAHIENPTVIVTTYCSNGEITSHKPMEIFEKMVFEKTREGEVS